MKTDNYPLIEILEYRNLEQFVIPEIQRDYVWKEKDVLDLLNYIYEGYTGEMADKPYLGFIYAYNHADHPYKYVLVDGQQRITTIFLLLLACHHRLGKGLPEYLYSSQRLKIEYKVRQATQDFLLSFVEHCNEYPGDDFIIGEQIWYHEEFDNDRTIQSVITNFEVIKSWLNFHITDLKKFIKYVEDDISLSYFDIEESRQGEDLYIYMNSRGRSLEPNETLKARFLSTTADKDDWGAKWESWQDFFWKHKDTRPDADAGFNDFLRMAQVISMSERNYSHDQVSAFASGKVDQDPSFDKLPSTIEGLGSIYIAYQWLVGSEALTTFYRSQNEPANYLTKFPPLDKRQAYFLRILPVLTFLSATGCREDKTVVRFARFFYNIARKSQTVGKDISNQLPSAIKLMLEYGKSKTGLYDVCDLINYGKGRTILIDAEEILKLKIYKNAGSEKERTEIEQLLWKAEDHEIFQGEISFFLNSYCDPDTGNLDLAAFKRTWQVFEQLFVINRNEHSQVTIALLYYGYTWVRNSPYYYENYNCQNWYEIVRMKDSDALMSLLEDLQKPAENLDAIIRRKIHDYFKSGNLTTIDSLKNEHRLFHQIKILAALDYHTEKRMFRGRNGYIAKDDRYGYGDPQFFINSPDIFNIYRYISDGNEGRLMRDMKNLLQDSDMLNLVMASILNDH